MICLWQHACRLMRLSAASEKTFISLIIHTFRGRATGDCQDTAERLCQRRTPAPCCSTRTVFPGEQGEEWGIRVRRGTEDKNDRISCDFPIACWMCLKHLARVILCKQAPPMLLACFIRVHQTDAWNQPLLKVHSNGMYGFLPRSNDKTPSPPTCGLIWLYVSVVVSSHLGPRT